ncbi:hypothetical protein [Cloacibacillus evryensis]|uniref:hypothetical protein n=1 Tax=Cloacibacillus evryensis TaxID=508460 RepID=UPI00068550C9|nr:hypothetical protein [Cloacibacillus evryensis]MEA5034050.1 hypothetical protein [Cloacibacillus evryensis]
MTVTLENITTYLAIVTFTGGAVKFLIVNPLRTSIMALQASIDRLENQLLVLDGKMDKNKERLVMVEASAKQAHKRLDCLNKVLRMQSSDDK